MPPRARLESRLALLAIAVSITVFGALLVAYPPFYQSFDEAKYLGIGYQMLAGRGPLTLFGSPFLVHPPLWSTVVVAPDVWFGIDPLAWGRFVDAACGLGLIALVAAFGWQVRPAVGALAASGMLMVPYLHDITRTARLDMPAAMLCLLYVWLGIRAVRSGSLRAGVVAGLAFAVAFSVKEIALPYAPVPLIVGLLDGRAAQTIRASGAMLLAAAVGTSWWFLMYAGYTKEVYRLGTP